MAMVYISDSLLIKVLKITEEKNKNKFIRDAITEKLDKSNNETTNN